MGSPRRKKRTTGFWAVDDPRADVAPSFPPAAASAVQPLAVQPLARSAPASGSAASGSGVIRMLLEWHDLMRNLGRLDEELDEELDGDPMRTRLPVNLSRVAELRDEASVDCEVDAFGGKPQSPVEPPPAHLYSDSSRVTNPIYYSGSEPASRNVCRSLGCGFLAHSEKGFGGYCCRMCENGKAHGKRCELARSRVLRETRRTCRL